MKKHVLLIDNDENELDTFSRALNKIGLACDLTRVKSAEHAVKLLDNYSPDFIFIEHDLPRENGLQCLQEIKKVKNAKDVPIIIYSEEFNNEINQKAISMGAFDCIKRPHMLGTLVKKLKEIMIR